MTIHMYISMYIQRERERDYIETRNNRDPKAKGKEHGGRKRKWGFIKVRRDRRMKLGAARPMFESYVIVPSIRFRVKLWERL